MDDMVFLDSSKEFLRKILDKVKEQLSYLDLKVKDNYQIFPVEDRGIDFVGYVFRHNRIGIRKRISKGYCKCVIKIISKCDTDITEHDEQSYFSYKGFVIHGDTESLQEKYGHPLEKYVGWDNRRKHK